MSICALVSLNCLYIYKNLEFVVHVISFIMKYFIFLDMVGYNGNFPTPLAKHHKCAWCSYALRDPVQTECGHRICKECYTVLQQKRYHMCIKMSSLIHHLGHCCFSKSYFVTFLVEELVRLFAQLMETLSGLSECSQICTLKERCLTLQHTACIEIAAADGMGSWKTMR